jgi:sulfate transport system ATP-binding protein
MELADRVVVMNRGRIEQMGSTDELYERPASPFVFDFLGATNVLPAEIHGRNLVFPAAAQPIATESMHPSGPVDVYVRPGDLRLAEPDAPGLDVRICSVQRTGAVVRALAETVADGVSLTLEVPHLHHDVSYLAVGSEKRLRLMQYSIYPRSERGPAASAVEAPVLIGRERGRLG